MRDWLKKQATVQNILMVLVLIATLARNSSAWVMQVTNSSSRTADAVAELVSQTTALAGRVSALELDHASRNEIFAREFPRRAELEPRLKAIEDMGRENNLMLRRFLENYRR